MIVLPVHEQCNFDYRQDEEYFFQSLLPIFQGTHAAREATKDLARTVARGQGLGLALKVLHEFTDRPSGLYLPPHMVVKRFDRSRLDRVLWKVTRGLHFYETGTVLSDSKPRWTRILGPHEVSPVEFEQLARWMGRGRHREIFDYGYRIFAEPEAPLLVWPMLLWGEMRILVAHHHVRCTCQKCGAGTSA